MDTTQRFITQYFYTTAAKKEVTTTKTSLFKTTTETSEVTNPRFADYEAFAKELAAIYNDFHDRGYDVVNIVPLEIGANESVNAIRNGQSTYVGEVGFSITRGAIVVGKLRESV